MKTRELIKVLQEVDPEGESEVIVNGDPIYFAENLPGYYDGWYSVLIQDHSKDPYYNITGIRQTRAGDKVRLHLMSMEDVLLDNPEAIVELDSSLGPERIKEMEESVQALRVEHRQINADVQKWSEERERAKNDASGKS